ncbi:MAG TPA: AgmX/PglI C-terminal domain-containing protein [Chitinivibrionales bacterium]|nr:AgmX/PglI C-terminal domain-containing protein [Chitinivibrionales bacterium]
MSADKRVLDGSPRVDSDDEEQEPEPGRIIPLKDFLEKLKGRKDIFTIDKESRLSRIETACLALAFITGAVFATIHVVRVPPDFIGPAFKTGDQGTVIVSPQVVELTPTSYFTSMPKPPAKIKVLKPTGKYYGNGQPHGGVGSPASRIARMKAFWMKANRLIGVASTGVDQGGASTGIDKGIDVCLVGKRPLKNGGGPGTGRRLEPGIGVGTGIGPSGVQPGVGTGLDDPLANLLAPDGAPLDPKPRQHDNALDRINKAANEINHAILTGGRTKSSILHTVQENLITIRYAYNKWLRQHPNTAGKITVKFAIDEFGNVIFCDVLTATLQGSDLSDQVIAIVKKWNFGKIDKPGDITEAVYPLVFSM